MTEPTTCTVPVEFLRGVIALCTQRGYSPENIEAWSKDDKWVADLWRQAEQMLAIAKWGTPATGGEPAGTVLYTVHGTQYVSWRTKPPAHGTLLYTTQQSTQTQAGAVPLTEQAIEAMWSDHWDGFVTFAEAEVVVRATEEAHGIKGGQHG